MLMNIRILAALLLGLSSCKSTPPQIAYDWTGKDTLCESTLMLSDSSLVGVVGLNMIGSDEAVLYDRGGEYCLKLYKVGGDSLIWQRNLLHRGRGPLEAMMPNVNYMPEFDRVCVFKDNVASTEGIFWLDNMNVPAEEVENVWNVVRLADENPVRLRLPIDTVTYLVDAALETKEMFGLYCPRDSNVRNIGLTYPTEMSDYAPQTIAMVLSGFVAKRPGDDMFVSSSQHGHCVQLFNLLDGKAANVKTLYNEMPSFEVDKVNGGLTFRNESQLGFWVFATEGYVYLLDAGVTTGDMRQGKRGERTVNVFLWDGTPVRKLRFDRDLAMFTVTPDDRYLYFTTVDMDAGEEQVRRVTL